MVRKARGFERSCREFSGNHVASDVDEPEVVVAGVVAQPRERLLHVEAKPLGQHTFGLLDDDAAVQSIVELLVHDLGLLGSAVLENGDGGDVGESLGGDDVGCVHRALVDPEQVQGADDRAPQSQRQGVR